MWICHCKHNLLWSRTTTPQSSKSCQGVVHHDIHSVGNRNPTVRSGYVSAPSNTINGWVMHTVHTQTLTIPTSNAQLSFRSLLFFFPFLLPSWSHLQNCSSQVSGYGRSGMEELYNGNLRAYYTILPTIILLLNVSLLCID